jgi:hypothetical protein
LARKEKVDNQDKMEGMAETEYSFSISPIWVFLLTSAMKLNC